MTGSIRRELMTYATRCSGSSSRLDTSPTVRRSGAVCMFCPFGQNTTARESLRNHRLYALSREVIPVAPPVVLHAEQLELRDDVRVEGTQPVSDTPLRQRGDDLPPQDAARALLDDDFP